MNTSADSAESPASFYDALAPQYDAMTRFSDRFGKEREFFQHLAKLRKIRSAIDAGCGTGLHALLLAAMGASVTAIDPSGEMLSRAGTHAREQGLSITTIRSDIEGLASLSLQPVDAIVCMGNTLAHVLTDSGLRTSLKNLFDLLLPGAHLVLQLLNYDRILSSREEILGIREVNGVRFTRRYTYHDPTITFTIEAGSFKHSTELRPWASGALTTAMIEAGFSINGMYGSLQREEFDAATSTDLVLLSQRR